MVPAASFDGKSIRTVEGHAKNDELSVSEGRKSGLGVERPFVLERGDDIVYDNAFRFRRFPARIEFQNRDTCETASE